MPFFIPAVVVAHPIASTTLGAGGIAVYKLLYDYYWNNGAAEAPNQQNPNEFQEENQNQGAQVEAAFQNVFEATQENRETIALGREQLQQERQEVVAVLDRGDSPLQQNNLQWMDFCTFFQEESQATKEKGQQFLLELEKRTTQQSAMQEELTSAWRQLKEANEQLQQATRELKAEGPSPDNLKKENLLLRKQLKESAAVNQQFRVKLKSAKQVVTDLREKNATLEMENKALREELHQQTPQKNRDKTAPPKHSARMFY